MTKHYLKAFSLAALLTCTVSVPSSQAQVYSNLSHTGSSYSASSHYSGPGYSTSNSVSYGSGTTYSYNPYFGYTPYTSGGFFQSSSTYSNRNGTWTNSYSSSYNNANPYGVSGYYNPYLYLLAYGGYYGNAYGNNAGMANNNPPANAGQKTSTPVANRQPAQDPAPAPEAKPAPKPKVFTDKDIFSGEAINDLINQLIAQDQKVRKLAKTEAIDPTGINFQGTSAAGQYAYLMLDGADKLPWGDSLSTASDEAKQLQTKIQAGYKTILASFKEKASVQTEAGSLRRDVNRLSDLISAEIHDIGMAKYVVAKQIVKTLDLTLQFLQETPEFQVWKRGIKAADVAELTKFFEENHIRVSPALPGTEQAYQTLYAALKKTVEQLAAPVTTE